MWGELDWQTLLCATEAGELGCRPEEGSVEPQQDDLPGILLHTDAHTAVLGTRSVLGSKLFHTFRARYPEQPESWSDAIWDRYVAECTAFNPVQCAILRKLFFT